MSDTWDSYAAEWDQQPGTKEYAAAVFESLEGVLEGAGRELAGARIVDFGCGTGLLTERLVGAGAEVTAIDTSAAMLAVLDAKIARRAWTTVTTLSTVDHAPRSNDVVACSSVCSFVPDYPATVAGLTSLLRPGGLFIQWDWERTADDHPGLTRDEITETLSAAGLDQVTVTTAFEVDVEGRIMAPLIGHGRRPQVGLQ